MLFLIGLSMGNSQKAEGRLVSWYLNIGNYRPVSFSSVSHENNVTAESQVQLMRT